MKEKIKVTKCCSNCMSTDIHVSFRFNWSYPRQKWELEFADDGYCEDCEGQVLFTDIKGKSPFDKV